MACGHSLSAISSSSSAWPPLPSAGAGVHNLHELPCSQRYTIQKFPTAKKTWGRRGCRALQSGWLDQQPDWRVERRERMQRNWREGGERVEKLLEVSYDWERS